MSNFRVSVVCAWVVVACLALAGCSADEGLPDVVRRDTAAGDVTPVDDLADTRDAAPDDADALAPGDDAEPDATPLDDVVPMDDTPIAVDVPVVGVDVPGVDVPPPPSPIHIVPADRVLMLTAGASTMVTYSVLDATGTDVTSTSTLSIDDAALGAFAGPVFTTSSTRGGISHIHARNGTQTAETTIEVDRALDAIVVPGTPATAPTGFGGTATPSLAPTLVYPSDQTIVPPNLPSFQVHFVPQGGTSLYELSFVGATSTVRVYSTCTAAGGGCVITLDALTFTEVAIAARGAGTVQLSVRATTGAGAGVGTSAARTLGVTTTPLAGGIYFWVASSGSILRFDFGRAGAAPETFIGGGGPFACVGCHTLSRDGSRVNVGRFIPGPATSQIYDVATRTAIGATFGSNFATFSPDNTRLLASDGAHMGVIDTSTGMVTTGLAPGFVGSMPDWSPDGSRAVFSRAASVPPFGGTPGQSGRADLMAMPYAGGSFGAATTLVHSAGEDNYYPSYSPDGTWVLFNRSAVESYNAIDAHLWAVRSDGSGAPIALAAADGTGDLGNSWPKWAPFVQMYQGQPLMWVTVASRRDYGLRLQQQSRAADMRTSQLWMAAFRPNAAPGDPTSPAFWLPIQDLSTGNHIAQWAQQVRRLRCRTATDCPAGETCGNTYCIGVHP